MSKPLSLKKQIEQANIGESFLTDQARTGAYVAAKRAKSIIKTEEDGDQIRVTIIGRQLGPQLSPVECAIQDVSGLDIADRLRVFESFELCCGMNHGGCVCEPAFISPVIASVPVTAVFPAGAVNDAMARFLASQESDVGEEWCFTKDRPEFNDNGRVYRQQYLVSNPKRRRSVRVDEDDHERIIE